MGLVRADPELAAEDFGVPAAGPDLPPEARGFHTPREPGRDPPPLVLGEPGGRSRAGSCLEGRWAPGACGGEPLADGGLGHTEGLGDGSLGPAARLQFQGT
jgi:hypothetical protein